MGKRGSDVNWTEIIVGLVVLAGGIIAAVAFVVTQSGGPMPGGKVDRIAGTIVGIAIVPSIILICKGAGWLKF